MGKPMGMISTSSGVTASHPWIDGTSTGCGAKEEEAQKEAAPGGNHRSIIMTSSLQQLYDGQGFVVVPDLLDGAFIDVMRGAADRVVAKTRAGDWTERRIVGKQFPPYDTSDVAPDVWGVQHVMHPRLSEPAFMEWYGSERLILVILQLMECEEEHLQMGNVISCRR